MEGAEWGDIVRRTKNGRNLSFQAFERSISIMGAQQIKTSWVFKGHRIRTTLARTAVCGVHVSAMIHIDDSTLIESDVCPL